MTVDQAGRQCERRRTVHIRRERYELPCGARDCAACGARWQQDQRVRAVAASEQLHGPVALITVTAPGSAYFGWGRPGSFDNPRDQMEDWNRSARARWRLLHLAAMRPLRAAARRMNVDVRILYRSWEYQKRGALHLHLVMPMGDYHSRAFIEAYVHNLWTLAPLYHFGYVLGGDRDDRTFRHQPPPVPTAGGAEVARYVCKYVASIGSGKDSMATTAQRAAKRGSVLYVSPVLMRRSGVTMTTLRARRRVFRRFYGDGTTTEDWRVACTLDALQRGMAPLTRRAEDGVRELFRRHPRARLVLGATGEVVLPTPAPPPLRVVRCEPDDAPAGPVVVAVLASVWLGDPERPELGPIRTEVGLIPG